MTSGGRFAKYLGINMKICIRCSKKKALDEFHNHLGMKDGKLNKCRSCVQECVSLWRLQNPDARKREHERRRIKLGKKDRRTWLADRKKNALGRKVTGNKYAHNRRMLVSRTASEFDTFIFEEALLLREDRKVATGIKWHVDHIVPLKYKFACGLHVGSNIQVVPARWNVLKKNLNMDTYFPIVAGY